MYIYVNMYVRVYILGGNDLGAEGEKAFEGLGIRDQPE
jgi:hypothetical protein